MSSCRVPLVLTVLALFAAACGSPTPNAPSTPNTPTTPTTPATKVIVLTGNLSFGNVNIGTTATATFTIANQGNATLTFTGLVTSVGTGIKDLKLSPTSGTVPAGGSVTITATFTPTLAQFYTTVIQVTSDSTAGNNGINFSGFGVVPGPKTSFGDGKFVVGTDIASGRYFSAPPLGCYWERESGLGGTLGEIIANDFFGSPAGQWIVDIAGTDKGFMTNGCGTWNQSPRSAPQANTITAGMWLMGSQITAGTYSASVQSGCYWERLNGFGGTLSAIIANDFIATASPQTVAISPGDAGFDSNASCGTWTKTSSATVDSIGRQLLKQMGPAAARANRTASHAMTSSPRPLVIDR